MGRGRLKKIKPISVMAAGAGRLLAGATAWPPCAMGRKLLNAARPGVAGNSPPLY